MLSYSQISEGFIEDDAVVGTPQIPGGILSPDIDKNSNRGGWTGLVASIKERYASGSSLGKTNRTAEDLDPAITAAIHNITQYPTGTADDDIVLWRVRCKV